MSPSLQKSGLDARFKSSHIEAGGVRFHYVAGGSGAPLVLLHGWPLTWYSWRKVMPTLANHFTVIAPDLPGLGDSGPSGNGYEKHAIARSICAFVHALGYHRVALIGHDMGAPIAYAYARQCPDEVERLAILDVPLNPFGLDEFARRLHLWHFDFFQSADLAETLAAGRERQLIEHFYPSYNRCAITASDADEYARTYTATGSFAVSLAYYRAFKADAEWSLKTASPKLELPVLALGGEFAGAASPFASLTQVAHNVTGRILRNCGHYHAEEQPEALLVELLRFLDEDNKQ